MGYYSGVLNFLRSTIPIYFCEIYNCSFDPFNFQTSTTSMEELNKSVSSCSRRGKKNYLKHVTESYQGMQKFTLNPIKI